MKLDYRRFTQAYQLHFIYNVHKYTHPTKDGSEKRKEKDDINYSKVVHLLRNTNEIYYNQTESIAQIVL